MQETQETRVRSLGQEDPLEEKMAAHSSILAGIIPWTEESGGLQSTGSPSDMTEQLNTHEQVHSMWDVAEEKDQLKICG